MTEHKDLYVVNRYGDIFFLAKERIVKITPKRVYFKSSSLWNDVTEHIDKDDRVFEDVGRAKLLSSIIYNKRLDELREQFELVGGQAQEQQRAETFKEATWFNTRSSY